MRSLVSVLLCLLSVAWVSFAISCGDTIYESITLTTDLLNCPGNGINFGADNIILDCNAHTISGDGSGSDYGIYMANRFNVTVRVCYIGNFQDGVYVENSVNSTVRQNYIYNNTRSGLYLKSSTGTNVTNSFFITNGQYGAYLMNSSGNFIYQFNNFTNNYNFNAYEDQNSNRNYWNVTSGNRWSDFASNPGYPYIYVVPGPGDGIDIRPYGWQTNYPPVLAPIDDILMNENETLTIQLTETTQSPLDNLTFYTNAGSVIPGQFNIIKTSNFTADLILAPNFDAAGVYQVVVGVRDQGLLEDNKTITITVVDVNRPPNIPSNPSPENGATGVPINGLLSWTGGDLDAWDTVTYDVYFGNSTEQLLVASDLIDTFYAPASMTYSRDYYWRIVARDGNGSVSNGPTWQFRTIDISYIPGDVNGDGRTIGSDVTYLTNYFKGGMAPPIYVDTPTGRFYPAADVNGDCRNGASDVTYLTNYFKGGMALRYCPLYPPRQ